MNLLLNQEKFKILKLFCSIIIIIISFSAYANNGYKLWLDYKPIDKKIVQEKYDFIKSIYFDETFNDEVIKNAGTILSLNLSFLLNKTIERETRKNQSQIKFEIIKNIPEINEEGYFIKSNANGITIEAKSGKGILYGALNLLQKIHRRENIKNISIAESPKVKLRILNHWDNIDRTVERGYAGFSIWNWHELPENIEQRYEDYAMANASIGINGTVLTNVNANSIVLRDDYLDKAAALANVFRKYGIKVYLTARFSAPIELGKLKTADPLEPEVRMWWAKKVDEIYKKIPDFGGFLVKANSEGQPGPQDYGRNHADGANMLAEALQKHAGVVMWRAFVYSHEANEDRFKQAYKEFVPLDGKFLPNVLVQVKNGPIDFQPREPIHPMFGAMPKTPLMMEFQITKEYLGQGTHLVGLSKMYEEVLDTDTYVKGEGSTLAKVIDGSLHGYSITGMAGVSNIGTALNWTGNLFGQADWYAFGRLAWNPYLNSSDIFNEWVSSTFTTNDKKVKDVAFFLLDMSHHACVNYMTPLGLHHIMAEGHHYGPGPWVDSLSRADWTSVYYHKADKNGIGFDRTSTGSNAMSQYNESFRKKYENITTCPEEYLLWFHRVSWQHKMISGKKLWDEMIHKYDEGVTSVEVMNESWNKIEGLVDKEIFNSVKNHLSIQLKEAKWWRDACLTYFQSKSEMAFPSDVVPPKHTVTHYKNLNYPYAPGLKPKW